MGKETFNFGQNFPKGLDGIPEMPQEVGRNLGRISKIPKPLMTPRMVPKINQALEYGAQKTWNADEFVDEIRKEYDHKIKTAQLMGHPDWCNKCTKKIAGCEFCNWTHYVQCNVETLEWRKSDISAAGAAEGPHKLASEEEVKKTHFVLDLAIKALKDYQKKHSIQVYHS